MKHKNCLQAIVAAAIIPFSLSLSAVFAQEAIPATGGNATGDGGSASYSIGQVVYETYTGTGGSVAEGVQQPYEIWVYTSIEEAEAITLNVYPNPTRDFITLQLNGFDQSGLAYQLFDFGGKLLHYDKVFEDQTKIDMDGMVPAVYFIRVVRNSHSIKTFKVIKN